MRRGFWFVAGAGAGVYAMVRARRAAETFTPDGLRDRVAGLGVGAHLFADEVRTGMSERETELRRRFGMALDGPLQIEPPADGDGGVSRRSLALAPQPAEAGLAPQPAEAGLAPRPAEAGLAPRPAEAGLAPRPAEAGLAPRTPQTREGIH